MKFPQGVERALAVGMLFWACSSVDASKGGASNGGGGNAGSNSNWDGGPCTPDYACTPTAPSTGDDYADCVTRVNQFRACVCLGPLARNSAAEACADQQAQYDNQTGTSHSGFTNNICTPRGSAQNECPGWASVSQTIGKCMLQMFDEGPPPSSPCNGTCFQTYGHFINMTNTSYKSVACGFYTTASGQIWQ